MNYQQLPDDVLQYNMLFMPYEQVIMLCDINKKHQALCNDTFWKMKIHQDFNTNSIFYPYWSSKENYEMLRYITLNNFTLDEIKILPTLVDKKWTPKEINQLLLGIRTFPQFLNQDMDELLFEAAEETGYYGNKALSDYLLLMAKNKNELDTDNTYKNVLLYTVYGIIGSNDVNLFIYYFRLYQSAVLKEELIQMKKIRGNYIHALNQFFRKAFRQGNLQIIQFLFEQGYVESINQYLLAGSEIDESEQLVLEIINILYIDYHKPKLVEDIVATLRKYTNSQFTRRLIIYVNKLNHGGKRIDHYSNL